MKTSQVLKLTVHGTDKYVHHVFHVSRSYPVRRLFVRGLLRQLSSPALLAASYTGHPLAVAQAVMEEVRHVNRL